jgi:hypothetical protein
MTLEDLEPLVVELKNLSDSLAQEVAPVLPTGA